MERQVIVQAMQEAREVISNADSIARTTIDFAANRLRAICSGYNFNSQETLSALKRELRAWDISKRRWKSLR